MPTENWVWYFMMMKQILSAALFCQQRASIYDHFMPKDEAEAFEIDIPDP